MKRRHSSPPKQAQKNMPKHKNSDILRKLQDISQLMAQNTPDEQIRALLDIPLRTYQRYKARVVEQARLEWCDMVHDQLYAQLIMLKNSYEHTYRKSMELLENTECKNKVEVLREKDTARENIVSLLINGPYVGEVTLSSSSETKPYIETGEWRENARRLFGKDKEFETE